MTPDEASKRIVAAVQVVPEDVARAKDYILRAPDSDTDTDALAGRWVSDQMGGPPAREIVTDAASAPDECDRYARASSVRLAFYQAVWDLVNAGVLWPSGSSGWSASLTARHAQGGEGLAVESIRTHFPVKVVRPLLTRAEDPKADLDLFLKGAPALQLQPGIVEGIRQSLICFQRGLYLPALVMLAAATEATWIECATALSAKLKDDKLRDTAANPHAGIGQLVELTRKALEREHSKPVLKAAGVNLPRFRDAEVWTTALRERRNAVHWGKAASFIAQHSDAGTLILAAPRHLETLERIRGASSK